MFTPYTIVEKIQHLPDVWIFRLKLQDGSLSFSFIPGQFCLFKNPISIFPEEAHAYSIASSPTKKDVLEFCVKVYGPWTEKLVQLEKGGMILLNGPFGAFTWRENPYSVFLVGGIGITPVMSMLRNLKETNKKNEIVLLYGCRTPDTIAYKKELEELKKALPYFKITYIFSDLDKTVPFSGYHGFVTKEIITKEADLTKTPHFYVVGPPIFIEKMIPLLSSLAVGKDRITTENFA